MIEERLMREDLKSINDFLERRRSWMFGKTETEKECSIQAGNCFGCEDFYKCIPAGIMYLAK